MVEKEQVIVAILDTIDEFNEEQPPKRQLTKAADTVLYGKGSVLDSLAFVSFLSMAEERLSDDYGVPITLASEKAMAQKSNPFKTVSTLADYAASLLAETVYD